LRDIDAGGEDVVDVALRPHRDLGSLIIFGAKRSRKACAG
jgi:hypothetical protein